MNKDTKRLMYYDLAVLRMFVCVDLRFSLNRGIGRRTIRVKGAQTMKRSPCKGCTRKHDGCYDTCEPFRVFREEIDRVNTVRRWCYRGGNLTNISKRLRATERW